VRLREFPAGTWAVSLTGGGEMLCAGRHSGDFSDPALTGPASRRLVDLPWTWLQQVHGADVVVVKEPGACSGEEADAAITACAGAALAVFTADCAPVGLASPEGVIGAIHAGWRGLVLGVVGAAVAAMRSLGAGDVVAAIGPCIKPHAYGFSRADLERVAALLGRGVLAVDSTGRPALDLPAAVRAALSQSGARTLASADACTHCSANHWSWRARGDRQRQANVVWRTSLPAGES